MLRGILGTSRDGQRYIHICNCAIIYSCVCLRAITDCSNCERGSRFAFFPPLISVYQTDTPRNISDCVSLPSPCLGVRSRPPISEKLLVNTNKQYFPKDRDMPSIPMMYTFDPHTRVHTGSRPAQVVGGKALTQSSYATTMPPPASIPEGHVARWTGTAWETVEDHRQHMDSKGTKTGGTPYWLPAKGDDWQSPPRYTEALGPLPSGAVTVRPEKPLAVIKEEKKLDIRSACDVAIVASLTMPTASPSATEVSVAAASLAAVDPDGPDTLLVLHTTRRDELLAAVDAADSVEAVRAVDVSYDV